MDARRGLRTSKASTPAPISRVPPTFHAYPAARRESGTQGELIPSTGDLEQPRADGRELRRGLEALRETSSNVGPNGVLFALTKRLEELETEVKFLRREHESLKQSLGTVGLCCRGVEQSKVGGGIGERCASIPLSQPPSLSLFVRPSHRGSSVVEIPSSVPRPSGFFVCGGHVSGVTLADISFLDPSTGRWNSEAPMPTPRHGCAAGSVGGVLYVFGGAHEGGVPLDSAERYDFASKRWEVLPPMPTPRHGCACAVNSGRLYVLGGYDGNCVLSDVERFDPAAGAWEVLNPLITSRARCAAAAVNGLVYAIGGMDDRAIDLADVECYDFFKQVWNAAPSLQTPRCACACVALGGLMFVFGGRGGGPSVGIKLASTERFDSTSDRWELVAPMPSPRDNLAAAPSLALGYIFVLGGRSAGSTLDVVERYDPKKDTWDRVETLPSARCGCAAASI